MYGIIDIGSNTVRLSIYKKNKDNFSLMLHQKIMAGLAGYVDKKGNLSEKGIKTAINALLEFKYILTNVDCKEVFVFATASLRNIKNTDTAMDTISARTGFNIDLISGVDEATYDFVGATHLKNLDHGILVDIGGGSTEVVFYTDGKIKSAHSLPIGSLNLYSRFVKDILPSDEEMLKLRRIVREELTTLEDFEGYHTICGVGGSIRGACKLFNEINGLPATNSEIDVKSLRSMLLEFTDDRKFAIKHILKVSPDRIHTIIPGMAILEGIIKKYNSDSVTISNYGVREGYLYTKLFLEDNSHEKSNQEELHAK